MVHRSTRQKAIAIIATNPEFSDVISLEGVADTKNPCLPILAVPTTSGTAAEVTINYVITDEENHRKFVCVDPHDIPLVAFVDSDMMMGMPKSLAAATGMDAMTHAIEGFITKGAWEMTDMLHIKAIEIIGRSLRDSVNGDQAGREAMALGAIHCRYGLFKRRLGLSSRYGTSIVRLVQHSSRSSVRVLVANHHEIQQRLYGRKIS